MLKVKLQEEESDTAGYISWASLEKKLRLCGELDRGEKIAHLKADEGGITYYVVNKAPPKKL